MAGPITLPTIAQSLSYMSLQNVVAESVSVAETHAFPGGIVNWYINIQVSTRPGTPVFDDIYMAGNYFTNYNYTHYSTPADFAGMMGDVRFKAIIEAVGGSDRVLQLNDVEMRTRWGSITDGTVQLAQSFTTPSGGYGIGGVDLMLKKVTSNSTVGDIIVEIQTDSSDSPSGTVVSGTSVTVPDANIPDSFGWVTANFTGAPTLTSTTKYWIVVRSTTAFPTDEYILWRAKVGNATYPNGQMRYKPAAGSWTAHGTPVDNLFRVKKGTGGVFSVDIDSRYKARWQ